MDKYYGLGDPIWQNYWTMAVIDSTNLLMQQISIPRPGTTARRPTAPGVRAHGRPAEPSPGDPCGGALKIELARPQNGGYSDIAYVPRGPGRSMFTVYDTFGYDNFSRVNEAGHFWDVYAAMLALTTSETNFLGVDRGSDALRYSLPYYTTFNLELAPLFNNYWTQNVPYYSPQMAKQSDGTAIIQLPPSSGRRTSSPLRVPGGTGGACRRHGHADGDVEGRPVSTWSARFYAQVWSMPSSRQLQPRVRELQPDLPARLG